MFDLDNVFLEPGSHDDVSAGVCALELVTTPLPATDGEAVACWEAAPWA